MPEQTPRNKAYLIHTCPFGVLGGGEMNVRSILESTEDMATWQTFGVDNGNSYKRFIPPHIPMTNLGQRWPRYPSFLDIQQVLLASEKESPLLFTSNDTRTLGIMTGIRALRPNLLYLWQCVPKRPDIRNPVKRILIETRNALSARTAKTHVLFSPECAGQLERMGIQKNRIHMIPQLLNPACDRTIRTESPRDSKFDTLRILIVSRLTKTKGMDKLPHLLKALDDTLHNKGMRMSVTLIGNPSHGQESGQIIKDIRDAADTLKNIRFAYDGYLPPRTVYEYMANHDISLSLAGTEGYSVSLIEGLNMGLPHAVQPVCTSNVDVIQRSGAGWILSGNVQEDAAMLSELYFDEPKLLQHRHQGYAFVDSTTGLRPFREAFASLLHS